MLHYLYNHNYKRTWNILSFDELTEKYSFECNNQIFYEKDKENDITRNNTSTTDLKSLICQICTENELRKKNQVEEDLKD